MDNIFIERPSKEGLLRHPPDGIYRGEFHDDPEMWEICTCRKTCKNPCKGECGCRACHQNYMDFLSCE